MEEINVLDISDCTDVDDIISKAYVTIAYAPIIDAVPVVRCGDCRWYDSAFYVCSKCGACVNRDFFCADGEREEKRDATDLCGSV